jgi:teichuronic acid biosynthesis glycosyltransferase TuaC
VRVIENGIDPERFRPLPRAEARQLLGLPDEGPLLVSVGTLAPRKGFHLVLEAVAALAARFPGIRFAMVGGAGPEGAMEEELRALAARLGIPYRAIFAGPRSRDELAAWYSAADLFVLASAHEGCPNVVLEALACGTPVVATPVGNVPEILDGSERGPEVGLLTERSVPALVETIGAALERSWDREAVRARVLPRTWPEVGREAGEEIRAAVAAGAGLVPAREGVKPSPTSLKADAEVAP